MLWAKRMSISEQRADRVWVDLTIDHLNKVSVSVPVRELEAAYKEWATREIQGGRFEAEGGA